MRWLHIFVALIATDRACFYYCCIKWGGDMKQCYDDLRDYHTKGIGIDIKETEWQAVRVTLLSEDSNDVSFTKANRSALVLTIDGCQAHSTRMEGIKDDAPSMPGQICFIPENAEVQVAWKNHDKLQRSILVDFDKAIFSTYTPDAVTDTFDQGHLVPLNFKTCTEFEYLIRILGQEVVTNGQRGQLFAETAIRLLSMQIAKSAWTRPQPSKLYKQRADLRVNKAIEFIEINFSRDISLLDLAAVAGLSPTQLTYIFQQTTGETPYSYVIARRLRQAIHLLRYSDQPIAHIALDVGFADQAHMTRTFQRRQHTTPKVVRDKG